MEAIGNNPLLWKYFIDPKEEIWTSRLFVSEEELVVKTVMHINSTIKIDRAGIYTGLIKDRVDISSFKEHLFKDDFGRISLPKEYRKHLVTGQGIEV